MYTTAKPCAIYWSNVGTIVYSITEKRLLELTGDAEQNPTFDLPCREVLARGQKDIVVIVPFTEIEDEVAAVHQGYWD
ncbi:Cytosine deaminase [Brachybacterium faecium]|nr:Cytosine deaminase [Brachybacterium faecium]